MKKILVIRNDKIGDFMLAWPAFAMLKQSMPDAEITALIPSYTKALAVLCPSIDRILVDCEKNADQLNQKTLIKKINSHHFDAVICFFLNAHNATLVWKAEIPFRLAPATKIFQFLYNHRVTQHRSKSEKPEYQYNLDLIRVFLEKQNIQPIEPTAPYLRFSTEVLAKQRTKLSVLLDLDENKPWLYVHAGNGGSANNLSLIQYSNLVIGMCNPKPLEVVLTAGPGEEQKAAELQKLLNNHGLPSVVYDKNDGLQDFTRSIACASAFIASSTGPLHIAATVDVPTIGFFSAKRSATPLRWQSINSHGHHLAFAPPISKDIRSDMFNINIEKILPDVMSFIARVIPFS
ncbi:glycosyltransferase family 9 protein [Candidatus Enterovibrio altilux]|uniref:ADP-heptose--lipooligosaccharide heptosyltransferase II n=1 Tax=Candidatus Enterovibrio altilux TaxID=1927128 RepID=A0A291B8P2_9GAMM|nr:glycosyltransferase family 9 protein [Candidatus Enterovibrio luxaltus]ATF09376.1 ADP-heptose--lipooligosaccharide heptosyltransferase II [Candidatus Enterovibrio luxaltus]